MKKKYLQITAAALFTFGMIACGGNSSEQSDANHSEMHADHEGHEGHDMDHAEEASAELLPIPENAGVAFGKVETGDASIDPETGEEKFSVMIEFQVNGMEVEPAGELLEGKGHHHLIINGGPIDRGTIVPADSLNIHYGKGQLETEIQLPRGSYILTMQFADGYHQSYGEQMSATTSLVIE